MNTSKNTATTNGTTQGRNNRRARKALALAGAGIVLGALTGTTLAVPASVAADYSTDLAVSVKESADPTLATNQLAYTVTVTNKAGTVSPPVTLEMAYLSYLSSTTNDQYCRLQTADATTPEWSSGDGLYYQCYIGDVAPGKSISWQVNMDTSAPRQVSIDVEAKPYLPVWIGNPTPYKELNPADNRVQQTTTIAAVPTSLRLSSMSGTALFGKPATYAVTLNDASNSHQWLCTPLTVQVVIDGVSTTFTGPVSTPCGSLTYRTSSLSRGTHHVQVFFAGNGTYLPSQSNVFTTIVS